MRKKTILSLLGVALCSMATMAQTYKLTDMTETEFEAGSNTHFQFDQYRFASETYTSFPVYTETGRVNFFDRYWPEYFQGTPAGESVVAVGGNTDYYSPQKWSWAAKEVGQSVGEDGKDPLSFIYISRIDENTYETYPTLRGQAAISFTAPAEGYYKVTAKVERMDQNVDGVPGAPMAKFRFRQQGIKTLAPSSTLGMDVLYGMDTDPLETFIAKAGTNYDGADKTYKKTQSVTNVFYVHIKAGDMITAEADISHLLGTMGSLSDTTTYWAREAWARTRWTQFDAEVVTQQDAEASGRYVDPYSANDEYIQLFKDLFTECSAYAGDAVPGVNIGEYDEADIDAFWNVLNAYGEAAKDPNLLGFTAKTYYERLTEQFKEFKAKAFTVDFQLPENRWLFQIPANSALYPDFEKQFLPSEDSGKAENSPWDFKTYTVASGIYNNWQNFGTGSMAGAEVTAFYNGTGDWLYLAKTGNMHPTTAISPVITFTAEKDGLYRASTRVQRNKGNNNANYMYMRYRFVKGGIEDGVTSVAKDNFMFADAYGHKDSNKPVSRDFYVTLKAGDVITFEEDAYTAGSNGSAGTDWEKLMVLMIPAESAQDTINANLDKYFDPYQKATDFAAMDSVLNVTKTFMESVKDKIKEEPQVGEYPEAAKWEIDDAVAAAEDLRNDDETTQVELNLGVVALSNAFSKFQASLTVRYEDGETFESGAYYIEKDGLYLTVDSFWTTGTATVRMYAHFEPIITPLAKNNQVFNVQFNETYTDPLRFTLTTCPKDETWADDGEYHITEKGEIRMGNTVEAQSNTNNNHTWRNHSLIYDGEKWCIFNVQNNWSIVFTSDLTAFPTMPKTKEYLYKFVKFGTPGVSVENINADAQAAINVFNVDNGVGLSSAEAMAAVIYDAAGKAITNVELSSSPVTMTLPAGFYVVKAANGATAKVMIK